MRISSGLTFGELETTTGLFLTELLALDHARIAHQQAFGFEFGTVLGVYLAQSAGNTQADSLYLAGDTAAFDRSYYVESAFGVGQFEGLVEFDAQQFRGKIFGCRAFVDRDFAFSFGKENSGYGSLATPDGVDGCHLLDVVKVD